MRKCLLLLIGCLFAGYVFGGNGKVVVSMDSFARDSVRIREDRLWMLNRLFPSDLPMDELLREIPPVDSTYLTEKNKDMWEKGERAFGKIVGFLQNEDYKSAVDCYEQEMGDVLIYMGDSERTVAFHQAICMAYFRLMPEKNCIEKIEAVLKMNQVIAELIINMRKQRGVVYYPDSYIDNLQYLSVIEYVMGKSEEVIACSDKILEGLECMGQKNTEAYATTAYNKALTLATLKRWDDVVEVSRGMLDVYEIVGMENSMEYLRALFLMGSAQALKGQYGESVKYYEKGMELCGKLELKGEDTYFFVATYLAGYYKTYGSEGELEAFYKKLAKALEVDVSEIYEIGLSDFSVFWSRMVREGELGPFFHKGYGPTLR